MRRNKKTRLGFLAPLMTVLLLSVCGRNYVTGDFYRADGICGIVVDCDDTHGTLLLLTIDEQSDLDADSAKRWASALNPDGWHLPTREEMEKVRRHRSAINNTLERKGFAKVVDGHTFYWTSTECSDSHVFACGPNGMQCYYRSNHSTLYRARGVREIKISQ